MRRDKQHLHADIVAVNSKQDQADGIKNRTRRHMAELRSAIADGWQIVQPIFARPLWSSLNDDVLAFHFVLQRERATRLMTVPESRTIRRFIRDNSLSIDKPERVVLR